MGKISNFTRHLSKELSRDAGNAIEKFVVMLQSRHHQHIKVDGDGLADRLTGQHETCDINTFRSGSSDRGASIRIPCATAKNKCGYIEDRRPGANADPYDVSMMLLQAALLSEGVLSVTKA